MTTKRWILLGSLMLLALAGHVYHADLPRARPGSPAGDSPVAALLAAQALPAAVWVPYPHQNLAHLRRAAGAGPETLRAVARLAGLPAPALPSFGPLGLPPSSEIAAASDEAGERFVLVARVYPPFAAFAKLAGRLADNPWLRGGEVLVEGRPAEVAWDGNLWRVASTDLALEALTPGDELGRQALDVGLAWIRVRQAVEPLPAGLYRLWEHDSGLGITSQVGDVESAATPDDQLLVHRLARLELFLLVFAGRQEALGDPARALAFFDQEQEQTMELPRIASLHEPGAERWSLPGESLLEIAGREPPAAAVGGWAIAALDSKSLEEAARVAPELDGLSGAGLAWGLWLDLRGSLAEIDRIARALAKVPIVPRRQVERWNDARLVLTPLAERYSHLSATVGEEPREFTLHLESR